MPKPDMLAFFEIADISTNAENNHVTFRSNIQTPQIYLKSTNLILETGG